jgi:hypothetical protein
VIGGLIEQRWCEPKGYSSWLDLSFCLSERERESADKRVVAGFAVVVDCRQKHRCERCTEHRAGVAASRLKFSLPLRTRH